MTVKKKLILLHRAAYPNARLIISGINYKAKSRTLNQVDAIEVSRKHSGELSQGDRMNLNFIRWEALKWIDYGDL